MGGALTDIALAIEGVFDRAIVNAIRKRVRGLRRRMSRPGEWRVTIAPSETRGEWDLGIHGPSGCHLASFMEPVDRLPDAVERILRERLVSHATEAA
jgi:hypothetical protein